MYKKHFFMRRQLCTVFILCLLLSIASVNGKAEETARVYNGFSGIYQQICIDGKILRQSGDRFILAEGPASDKSDLFLPRDMGDGSFAFENKESENRIATAEIGSVLPATLYNIRKGLTVHTNDFAGLDDNTQHWILEKKDKTDTYYLKSLDNNVYMGVSGGELTAAAEDERAEISFLPMPNESPLYLLSLQPGYYTLPENQRTQIERVYESVAGDVFEPCSPYDSGEKQTPRALLDKYYYEKIKDKNMTEDAFHENITWRFEHALGFAYVTKQMNSGYNVSMDLPGTEGVRYTFEPADKPFTEEPYGTQYFTYILKIYDKDDDGKERVQTIRMSIQDSNVGRKNAQTFCEVMAHIPYELRNHIKDATCYKSPNPGSGVYQCYATHLNIILSSTTAAESMIESIVHELGHSIDLWYYDGYSRFSMKTEWENAMKYDCYSLSDYAYTSRLEDFAEFCRFYFTGYTKQDWRRAIMILCPERYRLFKRVRMKVMDGYSLWDDSERDKEINVSFDYNDGGVTPKESKAAKQYSYYREVMPAEPTRQEREFLGWYTQMTGGEKVIGSQRIIDGEDHTLYAHWSDLPGKEITIRFDPANGEKEIVVRVRKNTRIKEKIPDPVRKDYKFFGWCTTWTDRLTERFDPVDDLVLFDEDEVLLRAQWDPLPHTSVEFKGEDLLGTTMWHVDFQGLAPCTIILAGYKDGVLTEIKSESFDAAYSRGDFNMTTDFDTLKVMTWNSLDGMIPLYECVTVDRKGE